MSQSLILNMVKTTWALATAVKTYFHSLQNEIVEQFLVDWPTAVGETRPLTPNGLPVHDYLPALETAVSPQTAPLVAQLIEMASHLHWGQTYNPEDFGNDFLTRYGWTELFGPRGVLKYDKIASGFLFLGPHIEYPPHWHEPEEIYVPLTNGAYWQKGEATPWHEHTAGTVVHHEPWVKHAMRTEKRPLLALYLWRGNALAQKSTIR